MVTNPVPSSQTPTAPVVDPERIGRTYAGLKKMEIQLDPNPLEYGPKRFNNRIAQVRAMLTRLEQIFLQTSEDLHYFKRLISARNALYELEKRELMINDPKCRVGRSQGEREALADVRLRPEIEVLQTLSLAAQDLEALMIVIKSKRTDLKDIQGRMREQMKLIEHDIGMGARWGVTNPSAMAAIPVTAVNEDASDINSILANADAAMGITDGAGTLLEVEETEDPEEDPAPHLEPAPVLVFGEDEVVEPEPVGDEPEPVGDELSLTLDEEGEGNLPEKHLTQEDADSFLEDLDSALDSAVEDETEDLSSTLTQGIDDLIASLSED